MSKIKNKKGGFSLVETVIALAVVVTVTASALSIIMYSNSARVKTANKSEALTFAQNIWECFKAADDETTFEGNMEFVINDYGSISQENGATVYRYSSKKFTADIIVDFAAATISIAVNDSQGKEIANLEYTKYIVQTGTPGGEA